MNKILFWVVLGMTLCVGEMRAQNVENADTFDVSATTNGVAGVTEGSSSGNSQRQYKTDNFEYADMLVSKFKDMLDANQKVAEDALDVLLPLGKKRNWFLTQRVGMSLLGGSDSDMDNNEMNSRMFDQEDLSDKRELNDGKINGGLAGEYTLSFIRGRQEDGNIKLNPLGFALNTGFVVAFDKQETVTCDLMAKVGIEAGFGHKMGVGFDFLFGAGKSKGVYYYLFDNSDEGEEPTDDDYELSDEQYTSWCAKVGGQLWFRTGLLSGGNNRDIHLFVRYVYSKDPHTSTEYSAAAFQNDWFEESWQIGLTYFYKF